MLYTHTHACIRVHTYAQAYKRRKLLRLFNFITLCKISIILPYVYSQYLIFYFIIILKINVGTQSGEKIVNTIL